jgi:hypothetical protein
MPHMIRFQPPRQRLSLPLDEQAGETPARALEGDVRGAQRGVLNRQEQGEHP